MTDHLILVEQLADWKVHFPARQVITAREYLTRPEYSQRSGLHVINLCRGHRYLSTGYYCSLLAEARGHKVVPTVRTLQDLSRKSIYTLETGDIDRLVQKVLGRKRVGLQPTAFEMTLFFGQCSPKEMQEIATQLFTLFRAPLLKVEFRRVADHWRIDAIRPLSLASLGTDQEGPFFEALERFTSRKWQSRRGGRSYRYDVAILQDPEEQLPPSSRTALAHFIRAGRALGMDVELIDRRDFGRLAEYDALFIRETTRIDHHTYRFARKADSEGMVVIDDPDSILRCTNKVYLAELLATHKVPAPKSVIVRRENLLEVEEVIGYPVVLKIPDGSFSRGVFKAESRSEMEEIARRLLKESDLILAQEFVYTEFDWRIGVLNRQPLYACQYFMSKKHWQIVNHQTKGAPRQGGFRGVALEDVPRKVINTALRAARLIGDGLYGVDVKETARGVMVIEVNDNPNLDAGVEDSILGADLYRRIMGEFLRRLEKVRR